MSSYRRKLLDQDLAEAARDIRGTVLDIGGGRRRGSFMPPAGARWIVLDLDSGLRPGLVGDARNLPVKSGLATAPAETHGRSPIPVPTVSWPGVQWLSLTVSGAEPTRLIQSSWTRKHFEWMKTGSSQRILASGWVR